MSSDFSGEKKMILLVIREKYANFYKLVSRALIGS